MTILQDGVRYQYGFVADDERFLEEWLYAWPTGRKQSWFERDYKPRKAENLERGYLQGRYGAIPFLGPLARVAE